MARRLAHAVAAWVLMGALAVPRSNGIPDVPSPFAQEKGQIARWLFFTGNPDSFGGHRVWWNGRLGGRMLVPVGGNLGGDGRQMVVDVVGLLMGLDALER